jgi:hypothetical protein
MGKGWGRERTGSSTPVMNEASSLARYTHAFAISEGSAGRPMGTEFAATALNAESGSSAPAENLSFLHGVSAMCLDEDLQLRSSDVQTCDAHHR